MKSYIHKLFTAVLMMVLVGFALQVSATGDVTSKLYADGSVACTGADDFSDPDGRAVLNPVFGGAIVKVRLNGAEPNRWYTVALYEEPSCANAKVYNNAIHTDNRGDGNFVGIYPLSSGEHNVLVDVITDTTGLSNPKHAQIATQDAIITVP